MLRPALTTGLMILALAVPASADGPSEPDRPAGYGRVPSGAGPGRRPVHARIHRYPIQARVGVRGIPVRPVSYGERDGPVFHAWLPRNTNLPIYNIPPSYFPEY